MSTGDAHLAQLESRFLSDIQSVSSEEALHRIKSQYLGKQGFISEILRNLGQMPPEERPKVGAGANLLKKKIEEECRIVLDQILNLKKERKVLEESLDTTLPGRGVPEGGRHPLTQTLDEVQRIFQEIGFSIFEGPEIETEFYNFEALNIAEDHPARDMQDTFYIGGAGRAALVKPEARGKAETSYLLRTHTSPVQAHVMKSHKPPIRMIAPGAVYRRDFDVSHTPMFHQVEGLVVDKDVTFSDLKGTLTYFLQSFFGETLKVRFRSSYFPFTEPSAEADIQCVICQGQGKISGGACRLCKTTGWLEVMGCGMVHPGVFEKVGYDPRSVTGFAFGLGIERLTMLKRGIPDIRLFYQNDLRFLKQL